MITKHTALIVIGMHLTLLFSAKAVGYCVDNLTIGLIVSVVFLSIAWRNNKARTKFCYWNSLRRS